MPLERRFEIQPAFDKRNETPNCGIHGVEMRWYVIGPNGAIQFVLFTNWHLRKVQEELDARGSDGDPRFTHLSCHPLPADIGYHGRTPQYEGQNPTSHCHLLNGPCYYDGSGLQAEQFYETLVTQGGEALWLALEQRYEEYLNEPVEPPARRTAAVLLVWQGNQ